MPVAGGNEGQIGRWSFTILLFIHILLLPHAVHASILKFEDIDRWLLDENALEARADLSENAELVASIPFAGNQSLFVSPEELSLGSTVYKIEGPRLGANFQLGPMSLEAGYASNPKLDAERAAKLERYDLTIDVQGFKLITSVDLIAQESVKQRELLQTMKERPLRSTLDRSFLATKFDVNYALANLALLKAGVEFIDLDALLPTEKGVQTSAQFGFDTKIPGWETTQVSAGYFFSGNKEPDNFVLEKSRATAAVEIEVPGGSKLVVDCTVDGVGIDDLRSSFGVGYYFEPQAYLKLGYTKAKEPSEVGQAAAELTIRF